ncbi:MAG TPA: hypothetical protein VKB31_02805 [Trueperaceae bacterium]|nr:hypothetical protein [Trueperaceae bacterium]
MRLAGLLLAGALVLVVPWAGATRVVRAPHVEVLYDDPAMAGYAQQVAHAAEVQLTQVAALFGRAPFPVRIRLQAGDDVFNAFALPVPRPHVTFRPLFPLDGGLGFHSRDLTELVLRHELTHLVQLTDTRVPPGATPLPDIGLVGQGVAVLPPTWLLEGIAVWVESHGGLGGRLQDARTRALLWTLAADGSMPSLADVSLTSFQAWPGGRARYLLGASFIDRLVHEHGFAALVNSLHAFQAGHYLESFASAWQRTVGTDLNAEWRAWASALARQARDQAGLSLARALEPAGSDVGAPALAPDGRTLAWRVQGGVRLARLQDGALRDARTLHLRVTPEALTWTGARTLVLAAVAPEPGTLPSDLFALDVRTGALTRLTHGAHAHLPRAAGNGCVLYVRDVVPEGASLRRWCPTGGDSLAWRAPAGDHVVGLAVSASGRVAVSLYRPGGVDLALLTSQGMRFLTRDAASEVDPAWQGEDALLFASDASGLFQLRRLPVPPSGTTVAAGRPEAAAGASASGAPDLTAALGGAEEPVRTANGTVYRTLLGDGFALAWLPAGAGASRPAGMPALGPRAGAAGIAGPSAAPSGAPSAGAPRTPGHPGVPNAGVPDTGVPDTGVPKPGVPNADAPYPDTPYSFWPSLLPYGWLPTGARLSFRPLGAGLQLTALGLDDSARHALDLSVGYDTGLTGPLAGAYGWLRYAWNMPNIARAPGPPPPLGVAFEVGAWPHGAYLGPVDEVAYGVSAEALLRTPVAGYAGSLDVAASLLRAPSLPGWRPEARFDAVLDRRTGDVFGAVSGGTAFAAHGRLSYGAAGMSAGAWLAGASYPHVHGVPVVWHVAASAGYRPLPPVPVTLPPWAATLSLGGRVALPVRLRLGGGLFALERLDLEPAARLWGGAGPDAGGTWSGHVGAGADLGVWADTVLDYEALARFGVRGGYADGWWLAVGASIPY